MTGRARPQAREARGAGAGGEASDSGPLKELVEAIALELVDHPDKVSVHEVTTEHNSVIELRVAKDDIGKVIGKEGRTAQSMRTILTAAAQKVGRRAHLDILD